MTAASRVATFVVARDQGMWEVWRGDVLLHFDRSLDRTIRRARLMARSHAPAVIVLRAADGTDMHREKIDL